MNSQSQRTKNNRRNSKYGRWTQGEISIFDELIEKFGSNWKRIQQHLNERNLTQIRSHAQKYFKKIGKSKIQELRNKAKILQAHKILQQQSQRLKLKNQIKELQLQKTEIFQNKQKNQQKHHQIKIQAIPTIQSFNNINKESNNIKEQQLQAPVIELQAPIKELQAPIQQIINNNQPSQINQNYLNLDLNYYYNYINQINNQNIIYCDPSQLYYYRFESQ